MKLFNCGKDGGPNSTVWGYWLCEFKPLFSIALLYFEDGSREAYHSHAFNCISWVLKGSLVEKILKGPTNTFKKSFKPVITRRDTFHKISSRGRTWVLTFRGPWAKSWEEYLPETNEFITLKSGRKIVKNNA